MLAEVSKEETADGGWTDTEGAVTVRPYSKARAFVGILEIGLREGGKTDSPDSSGVMLEIAVAWIRLCDRRLQYTRKPVQIKSRVPETHPAAMYPVLMFCLRVGVVMVDWDAPAVD